MKPLSLLVLRHAKAVRDGHSGDDRERPLTERGRRDAPTMGKVLRKLGFFPDIILCSPAVRTRQTVAPLVDKLGEKPPVQFEESIYEATAETLVELIANQTDVNCILVIGHNPGLEDLIALLSGGRTRLPTCGLAKLEFDISKWSEIHDAAGRIACLLTPSIIDDL